jgi:hypothetical protein
VKRERVCWLFSKEAASLLGSFCGLVLYFFVRSVSTFETELETGTQSFASVSFHIISLLSFGQDFVEFQSSLPQILLIVLAFGAIQSASPNLELVEVFAGCSCLLLKVWRTAAEWTLEVSTPYLPSWIMRSDLINLAFFNESVWQCLVAPCRWSLTMRTPVRATTLASSSASVVRPQASKTNLTTMVASPYDFSNCQYLIHSNRQYYSIANMTIYVVFQLCSLNDIDIDCEAGIPCLGSILAGILRYQVHWKRLECIES